METLTTAQIIQFILSPGVMITACALLLNNLGSRHAEIASRLRSLSHERFELLQAPKQANNDFDFTQERIYQIEGQIPDLLRHHGALHNSLFKIYVSIVVFLASMIILAGAAITQWVPLRVIALTAFLSGIGILLVATLDTVLDFRQSHKATESEVKRICGLRS